MKERERLTTKIMTNVMDEVNSQISEAYEMGLNTAWEAAKRANDIDSDVYDELFPKAFIEGFYESYTAKEVIEKFAEYDAKHEHDDDNRAERHIMRAIQSVLYDLPSVTPKSETVTEFADRCRECGKMRKGHWIWNFDKGYCKCSECGIGMGHKEFDYCPNCGCRMVDSQESEDKE